jgi:hypothetical protein
MNARTANQITSTLLALIAASASSSQADVAEDLQVHQRVVRDASENPRYRRAACQMLARLGPNARPAIPALLEALGDETLGYWAAESLSQIGPEAQDAVQAVLQGQKDLVPRVRLMAHLAVAKEGPFPALIKALETADARDRLWAIHVLDQVGSVSPTLVPTIAAVLQRAGEENDDPRVRGAATLTVLKLVPNHVARVSLLTRLLLDQGTEPQVRALAAIKLGQIGPQAQSAVVALIQTLKHADRDTRLWAAWSLGQISTQAGETVPDLRAAQQRASEAHDPELYELVHQAVDQIQHREKQARRTAEADHEADREYAEFRADIADKKTSLEAEMAAWEAEKARRFASSFGNPYVDTAEDLLKRSDYYRGVADRDSRSASNYAQSRARDSGAKAKQYEQSAAQARRKADDYRRQAQDRAREIERKARGF